MITELMWICLPFAVYRLASMLATEEGPFAIFDKLRNLYVENDWFGRGIRCPLCVSFWVSLVALLLAYYGAELLPIQLGIIWIGLSGMAATLIQLTKTRY